MSITRAELDDFHQFAVGRLASGDSPDSLDDLLVQWESVRNRAQINAAIREGLADIDAGRYRSAEDSLEELAQKYGFSDE